MVLRKTILIGLVGLLPYQLLCQHFSLVEDPQHPRYGQLMIVLPTANANSPTTSSILEDHSPFLQVFTGKASPDLQQPAILGQVSSDSQSIFFEPRFPFELEQDYFARLIISSDTIQESFKVQSLVPSEIPRVASVYPTSLAVPVNLIRFYIHFSVPMRRDDPYQYLQLVTAEGDTLENVFYPAEPALWGRTGTRLTVLLDPGRIKSGLDSHEAWGLALQPFHPYRLIIDSAFTSYRGATLAMPYEHRFHTSAEDRQSPKLENWRLDVPATDTRDALILKFDEPIDQAQALRWVQVYDEQGPLNGEVKLDLAGLWLFTPNLPWRTGKYVVKVNNQLEDLAGNSIRKPFELLGQPAESVRAKEWLPLPFQIKKKNPDILD